MMFSVLTGLEILGGVVKFIRGFRDSEPNDPTKFSPIHYADNKDQNLQSKLKQTISSETKRWKKESKSERMTRVPLPYLVEFNTPDPRIYTQVRSVDLTLGRWMRDPATIALFLRNIEFLRAGHGVLRLFVVPDPTELSQLEQASLILQQTVGVDVRVIDKDTYALINQTLVEQYDGQFEYMLDFVIHSSVKKNSVIVELFDATSFTTSGFGSVFEALDDVKNFENVFTRAWRNAQEVKAVLDVSDTDILERVSGDIRNFEEALTKFEFGTFADARDWFLIRVKSL